MNNHEWIVWLIRMGFPFETVTYDHTGKHHWPPCSPEDVAEVLAQMDPLGDWQTAKDQWLGAIITDVGFEAVREWRQSLADAGSIL
jgi:hypothetical protein